VSLFGKVTIQFAYYHCKHCGKGWRPWCDKLRLNDRVLTPAADEIAALAGVLGSFADGADRVLLKMAGLRLSESTVEPTTQRRNIARPDARLELATRRRRTTLRLRQS
jgi:hypothetical protein